MEMMAAKAIELYSPLTEAEITIFSVAYALVSVLGLIGNGSAIFTTPPSTCPPPAS